MVDVEKVPHANSPFAFHQPASVHKTNHQSAGENDAPAALEKAIAVVGALTAVAPPAASKIGDYLIKAYAVKE
jgi:hypothetical protein